MSGSSPYRSETEPKHRPDGALSDLVAMWSRSEPAGTTLPTVAHVEPAEAPMPIDATLANPPRSAPDFPGRASSVALPPATPGHTTDTVPNRDVAAHVSARASLDLLEAALDELIDREAERYGLEELY